MNEREWLRARDPEWMLHAVEDRLSQRKWVLLNCAVARRMAPALGNDFPNWFIDQHELGLDAALQDDKQYRYSVMMVKPNLDHLKLAPSSRRELEEAAFQIRFRINRLGTERNAAAHEHFERFAEHTTDGLLSFWDRSRLALSTVLYKQAQADIRDAASERLVALAKDQVKLSHENRLLQVRSQISTVQKQLVEDMNKAMRNYAKPAKELLAHFLHEQLGNPYRPYSFDPAWRTANVIGLARGIEADRGFDRMNMLADALMEAGCEDEPILLHLQEEREHQRGCWVLDLILGHDAELFAMEPLLESGAGGRHEPLGLAEPRNYDV